MPRTTLLSLLAAAVPVAVMSACTGGGGHSRSGGTTTVVPQTTVPEVTTTVTTIVLPTAAPNAPQGAPAVFSGFVAAVDVQTQVLALIVNPASDSPKVVLVDCSGATFTGAATSLGAVTADETASVTGTVSEVDGQQEYTAKQVAVAQPPPPPVTTTTTRPGRTTATTR